MPNHDDPVITNITSAPARREVQKIFTECIPDAAGTLMNKDYYEDPRSVLLQCTIDGEKVGGLLALHPSTHFDKTLKAIDQSVQENYPQSLTTRTIIDLAVLPEYRHMGIGRELVEQAEQKFREAGATLALLFVDSQSPESTHHFWEKMGYTPGELNQVGEPCLGLPPDAAVYSSVGSSRAGKAYYRYLDAPRELPPSEKPSPQVQHLQKSDAVTINSSMTVENENRRQFSWLIMLLVGVAVVIMMLWIF